MTNKCPFCKSENTKVFLKLKDYFLTQENFEINECSDCHLLFTAPFPTLSEIEKYYKSENYLSHNEHKKGIVPWIYNKVKKINIKNKYKIALGKRKNAQLFDYGCGVGDFLLYAKNHGCEVSGCDLSDDARIIASQKIESEILSPKEFVKLNDESFDVITMWHVLEHIANLNELTEQLYRLLSKKGSLVIAVPNYKSFDAEYYKDKWAAYDVPRHLNHFHKESLENVMRGKFELKKIIPLKWDAYYISMMSEKYIGNGNSFMKGVITGLMSNIKAKKSGEYSSLVYVFDKI